MTVAQTMKNINKKIPGILPPCPKSEIDGKVTDLASKSLPELLELRDRQHNLLKNHSFISKLEDKGAKLQAFLNKILVVMKEKQEEESTCNLLRNMKLSSETVQNVEWEGKIGRTEDTYLDSDDDSEPEDVMHILSQSTAQEKKITILKPERPSIRAEDLVNIGEVPHVQYIVDKTESNKNTQVTGLFKPFKTTKTNVHDPAKEVQRKKNKYWEVTAATPPPIVHSPAKLLTIQESLNLQKEHNKHLIEVESQHAAEKLMARVGIKMPSLPANSSNFNVYRDADSADSDESDPEGSDKEVHDEEPERGGVMFTVMK